MRAYACATTQSVLFFNAFLVRVQAWYDARIINLKLLICFSTPHFLFSQFCFHMLSQVLDIIVSVLSSLFIYPSVLSLFHPIILPIFSTKCHINNPSMNYDIHLYMVVVSSLPDGGFLGLVVRSTFFFSIIIISSNKMLLLGTCCLVTHDC